MSHPLAGVAQSSRHSEAFVPFDPGMAPTLMTREREDGMVFGSIKRRPRRRVVKAGIAAAAAAAAAGGVFFASTAGAAPLPTTARVAISMTADADVNSVRINGGCVWLSGYTLAGSYHYYYTHAWVNNSSNVRPTLLTYSGFKCEGNSQNGMDVGWDGPMMTAGGYRWVHISSPSDDS
jgi:hypothetical protein